MIKIIITVFMVIMSVIAFAAFGLDKYKAMSNRWRIRERTLFLLALLGGGPGAFLGMKFFHHKTRHKEFSVGLPVIMAIQLLILGFIWEKL